LNSEGGKVTRSVVAVANQLRAKPSLDVRSVNPQAVKQAIDEKTDKFSGYEQRDAHEFLSDLLDYIQDELEKEEKLSSAPAITDGNTNHSASSIPHNPMDDFVLKVEVCLTCQACGYAR